MSSTIDQDFIEYVVKSLVGKPDAVSVARSVDEKGVLLELTVDPEDLGRVIGKRGATAQSLRTLLRALGTKNEARYNLKIIDNGTGERPERPERQESEAPKPEEPAPQAEITNEVAETPAEEMPMEAPAPVVPEAPAAPAEEDETSDRLQKARDELADLDDLDI